MSKDCYLVYDSDGFLVCNINHRDYKNCVLSEKDKIITDKSPMTQNKPTHIEFDPLNDSDWPMRVEDETTQE
jgi:hypothetical protein